MQEEIQKESKEICEVDWNASYAFSLRAGKLDDLARESICLKILVMWDGVELFSVWKGDFDR